MFSTQTTVNPGLSVCINPASPANTGLNLLCCSDRHLPLSACFSMIQLVDEEKSVVMTEMDKLVTLCQQLQMGAKTPVQGKTATFQKVPTLRFCGCEAAGRFFPVVVWLDMHQISKSIKCIEQIWYETAMKSSGVFCGRFGDVG